MIVTSLNIALIHNSTVQMADVYLWIDGVMETLIAEETGQIVMNLIAQVC